MKALRVDKKKLIVAGAILALIVGTGTVFLAITKNNEKPSSEVAYKEGIGSKEFEAIEKTVEDYNKNEAERIERLAAEADSTEDLSNLSEADKGKVALQVIKGKVASNDTAGAQIFIDYLMLRADSVGVEASVYCYQLATTDAAKLACRNRLNEQARALRIIGPNESVTDDYLVKKDGDG